MNEKETLEEFQERVYKNKDAGKIFAIPKHLVKDVKKYGFLVTIKGKSKPLFTNLRLQVGYTKISPFYKQLLKDAHSHLKRGEPHKFVKTLGGGIYCRCCSYILLEDKEDMDMCRGRTEFVEYLLKEIESGKKSR